MQSNVVRIKEKMDIVTVVGGYVTLQKAGALLRARCPFHNEKSPSFTVSPVRQTYHCFGCGEHGDIFTFVEKIEGLDFRGALEVLAQKAGVELVNEKGRDGEGLSVSRDEKDELFAINEHAAVYYEAALKNEPEILQYLTNRGLSEKTLATFRIGFAKESWQGALDHLCGLGHAERDIERVGLIVTSDKSGGRKYDRFRSRIMFPIANAQGRVAGFTGRIWAPNGTKPDDTAAKYVNSPETLLYHKSSILYGLHIAKHHIRPLNCVLIVEGQMDLLTCHQVGYTNAVAISGTALTDEQVRNLSRLTKNFLLALDSDKAGIDATIKSIDKALAFGCDVKVVSFRGKDASEVLQNEGAEAVKVCVREAVDWCAYLLSVIEVRSNGDTRARARLVNETLIPLVRSVDNPLERDALLASITERTQLSKESLVEALIKKPATTEKKPLAAISPTAPASSFNTQPHRDLLAVALDIPDVRAHEKYLVWVERAGKISRPELTDARAHTLLLSFPTLEHALHVGEIMEELISRAEKEEYRSVLRTLSEAIRSAELAGDEEGVTRLAGEATELHKKLTATNL
jgi:DNA primase